MISAVFMGTPQAAVPSLQKLADVATVGLVVTRVDKPRGRSGRPQAPPVKEAATELGLEVAQPAKSREVAELLEGRSFDVGVVTAFGMILRPEVLAVPRRGFLNIHFSLLPRWRGAAPVERAIMAGDEETGVTIMVMDEGLDTGPILSQVPVPIGHDETGGQLRGRLASIGADLLADTLPGWVDGISSVSPQEEAGAVYASRIEAEDRRIGPDLSVTEAYDRVRALAPTPGARLRIDGDYHKILACRPAPFALRPGEWAERNGTPFLGMIDGALEIASIQPPGGRVMTGDAWLRGRALPSSTP